MQSSIYTTRINIAIDYIQENLNKQLNLAEIASVACFSPYHFHRLFRGIVDETLNNFIKRVRVERAAMALRRNMRMSITEIALRHGFVSSQTFSRAFKEHFGCTPSTFRHSKCGKAKSKICNTISKDCKEFLQANQYKVNDDRPTSTFNFSTIKNMEVKVKTMPEQNLAYLRHIGSYMDNPQGVFGSMIEKICKRAGPKQLVGDSIFIIYNDDPNITEHEKLRTDVGIPVPKDTKTYEDINIQTLKGGRCAVARYECVDQKEFEDARQYVYCKRLPNSGYQPDNYPPYEIYYGDPKSNPGGKFIFDICVPVKPL